MSWTAQLVHKPYARDGEGPDTFNCWALVRAGQWLGHGRRLPLLSIDVEAGWRAVHLRSRMALEAWRVVTARPIAGDILSMVGVRRDLHVAMFLDDHRLLHTSADAGEARIQRLEEFRFLGFDHFETWRHHPCMS